MNTNTTMNWKVMAGLLTVGLVSGSAFTFTKLLAGELTTVPLAQGRLTTAAVAVVVLMALRRAPVVVTPVVIARLAVLALLDGVIPYVLLSWAAVSVDAGLAGVLISTMPLFTAVLRPRIGDESIAVSMLGIAVSVAGRRHCRRPRALDLSSSSGVAVLAVIASAACYAAGTVYVASCCAAGTP
jgi:drug/metabolite transporter (DMT)-like permease